jgi:phosphatidylserine/phosphatidylglycerophosphate/cardiolipin synthase-like enzyme
MTTRAHPLHDLSVLDKFAAAPFPAGYTPSQRTFYSPVDDVHGALKTVLSSATRSLIVALYGFDDDELASIIKEKLVAEHVYVQLTLDSSQAGGVHERALLSTQAYPASSVAIGRSERGAIIHLKEVVVDGVIVVTGSTNWSQGGEHDQDNQLDVEINPLKAAVATARLGAIHSNVIQQMARKAAAADSPSPSLAPGAQG